MNIKQFNDSYFSRFLRLDIYDLFPTGFELDEQSDAIQALLQMEKYLISKEDMAILNSLSDEKKYGAEHTTQVRQMVIERLIDLLAAYETEISYENAKHLILTADSFNRPILAIKFKSVMDEKQWLKLLFKHWSYFDGCSIHADTFKNLLTNLDAEWVMQNCFPESYEKWREAQDVITVYRGAFESCKDGLSWTTDMEVALKFANTYLDMKSYGFNYMRAFCQLNKTNLEKYVQKFEEKVGVFTTEVNKKDCIFIYDRDESEVFIPVPVSNSNIKSLILK